jgi:hypothetical protein
MTVSDKDHLITLVAAAFHDVERRWTPHVSFDGIVERKTNPYIDEVASARQASREVRAIADSIAMHTGSCLFDDDDYDMLSAAIIATTVISDEHTGSVFQPLLTPASHPVIRALALADLNAAAMANTPELVEKAARDGDLLSCERELGIGRVLRSIMQRSELDRDQREKFLARMTFVRDTHLGFLIGRERRLVGELGPHKDMLAELINVEHIERVYTRVFALWEERQTMDFWELAADMGYQVPPA